MWFKKNTPESKLEFDVKIQYANHPAYGTYTYETFSSSADKALSDMFVEYGGTKFVFISSRKDGKSIAIPVANITDIAIVFKREVTDEQG